MEKRNKAPPTAFINIGGVATVPSEEEEANLANIAFRGRRKEICLTKGVCCYAASSSSSSIASNESDRGQKIKSAWEEEGLFGTDRNVIIGTPGRAEKWQKCRRFLRPPFPCPYKFRGVCSH